MKKRNNSMVAVAISSCLLLLINRTAAPAQQNNEGVVAGRSSALIDPTRPPSVNAKGASTGQSAFVVTGIFIYPDHKVAIINNQPVKIGDRLNEYIVTAISLNTVELTDSRHHTETFELTPQVKRSAP